MDSENYNSNYVYSPAMESRAYTMAFLSILSCAFVYTGLIFGSLAIIFALLSKGGLTKLNSRAKAAIFIGTIGIMISIGIASYSVYHVLTQYGSFEAYFQYYFESRGIDINTMLQTK